MSDNLTQDVSSDALGRGASTHVSLRGEEILAAVPSIGRAVRIEGASAPEADLTRALYEQYANQIFRYCLHQLGSREEAEDAVQSTFLNAFRGIKRGVVPELESAWLFKIAHNVCLSRRRTTWRRGRIESPADFDVVEEMTPAPSRRADELIGLQDVLEQMPENQRRAILLREWQGLSYREISEELELSQAAVETLIFRARRSLAAGLEQPPEAKKRRLARGADLGNILAAIKSLLVGGGAAAKVAATVAVVSAGTVVAASPVQQHRAHSHHPASVPAASTTHTSSGSSSSVAGPAASFPAASGRHDAKAPGHAKAGHLGRLFSRPDDSTAVAPPAEPAPVAVGPALSEPAATPSASEPPAAPQPAADAPHQATPAPQANDKSQGNDKSKTDGAATPAAKSGGDSQDLGKNGDGKKGSTTPEVTPQDTVTPAVQPATPPPSKGNDPKGNDSKRNGSKGNDSKGNDAKGLSAAAPITPTVTLAAITVPTPTPVVTTPDTSVVASTGQASTGKTKDRAKDNGK